MKYGTCNRGLVGGCRKEIERQRERKRDRDRDR